MSRVKRVTLRNVMGIQELEFEPGAGVTVIEGGNGVGKTSAIEGLKAAIGGGYDATLVRKGSDEAEVVLVLDDETEVTKRIKATGGGTIQARHPDRGPMPSPQSWLNGVALSFNPVAFLTDKDPLGTLLEAIPMEVGREQLDEAMAGALSADGIQLEGRHALEAIAEAHKRVYDERTAVNRTAKDKQKAARELKGSLPADFESPAVLENRLKELRGAHRDADQELTRKTAAIDTETERTVAAAKEGAEKAREQIKAQAKVETDTLREEIRRLEARVAEVEKKEQADLAAVDAGIARDVEALRGDAQAKKEEILIAERPRVNELGQQVARLEEKLRAADQHENTRKLIEEATQEAQAAEERSEALTAALGRLETLRTSLQDDLPIRGVSVEAGQLLVDGVPLHRANTARQYEVAAELAAIRAGDLPLVCVDGLERLQEDAFEAMVAALEAKGLQPIVTRVDPAGGPLRIRTAETAGTGA